MPDAPDRPLSGGARGGIAAIVVALAIVAGYLVFRPASPDPAPAPPAEAAGAASDFEDPVEDAVFEVEGMLRDLARQIRAGATGGAMYHVADDFSGALFLGETSGPGRVLGGVTLRRDETAVAAGTRRELRAWLDGLSVERAKFKIVRADLDGPVLRCGLKFTAFSRDGDRVLMRQGRGRGAFVRDDGRWRLRSFARESTRTQEGRERFLDVTEQVGLTLPPAKDDRVGSRLLFGRLFIGGIAAGDFDSDGDPDLYVPRAGPNALFRNDGGRFVECAAKLGVDDPDAGAAALFLDIDNDEDLDLLVTSYEPPLLREAETGKPVDNSGSRAIVLYRNEDGTFTDITARAGIEAHAPAMMACAADVEGDGDLDVYVCMYVDDQTVPPSKSEEIPADVFNARDGVANQLWINRGDGTFVEEAAKRGVGDTGWSLAASFADYDNDGDADLYVANDYGGNRLYRNRGDGTFEDATAAAKAADTGFGMGVTWFDADLDGDLDLYVSNMYSTAGNRILARDNPKLPEPQRRRLLKLARGNTYLENLGDGTFADRTQEAGNGPAGWAWGSAAYDYDNDGRSDLYVANGLRTSEFATSDL